MSNISSINHFISEQLRRLMVMGLLENNFQQIGEIKENLKQAGTDFNRNVKTIERDMNFLAEVFGVEYEAGNKRKEFKVNKSGNYDDLISLMLSLLQLRNKVNRKLNNEAVLIKKLDFPINIISKLIIGIYGCRTVEMDYSSVSYNKKYHFRLYPYEIINRYNKWLLIAFNPDIAQFRQYQIHSIENVRICENENFERDTKFDIQDFYKTSFYLFSNKKTTCKYSVKINKDSADSILRDFHLPHFELEKNRDGVILEFYSDSINEVVNWVFSLRGQVKIISPEHAVNSYLNKLKIELENY